MGIDARRFIRRGVAVVVVAVVVVAVVVVVVISKMMMNRGKGNCDLRCARTRASVALSPP